MPSIDRRRLLLTSAGLLGLAAARPALGAVQPGFSAVVAAARQYPQLRTVLVDRGGTVVLSETLSGPAPERAVNVKSVSKTILATLVGIAIDRGHLTGVDEPIAPHFRDKLPKSPDPRLEQVTVGHLLAMRSGLERTSGANYGRWTASNDWVRFALGRPFVDEPGGRMLYSTGNSHILGALLVRRTDRTLLQLAREWLGEPLGITISPWPRDPQGLYFGGNDMTLSPEALLRFARMTLAGGTFEGRRVVSQAWIDAAFVPQARSPHTGHAYGYGWFQMGPPDRPVHYGWGYGGQMVYVVPHLGVSVVITSDPTSPSGRTGYVRDLHALLAEEIIPAVTASAG